MAFALGAHVAIADQVEGRIKSLLADPVDDARLKLRLMALEGAARDVRARAEQMFDDLQDAAEAAEG